MPLLNEGTKKLIQSFVGESRKDLVKVVELKRKKFPSWEKLINQYNESIEKLFGEGTTFLNRFQEVHNELCVAVLLLEDTTIPESRRLEYEPKIAQGKPRFDFKLTVHSEPTRWIEVKTIHPDTQDDWEQFQEAVRKNRFPQNTEMILHKDWLGGELFHNSYSSRKKMIDNAQLMEKKIEACLDKADNYLTFLAFFSDGFQWHIDRLEDFIHYYRTGVHFPGDPFSKMEKFFYETEGISFKKTINHFAYIRRQKAETRPSRVVWSVSLPNWPFIKKEPKTV